MSPREAVKPLGPCERVDLLVRGGLVVTMDQDRRVLRDGYVAIRDGAIVGTGEASDSAPPWFADDVIDARRCAVIPGLVNAHCHAAMTLFRGLADDLPLAEWLSQHIWPAEAEFVTAEFVRLGATLAATEMVAGGVTACGDMYFFQHASADAFSAVGMRAVVGDGLMRFPTPQAETPEEGLRIQLDLNRRADGHLLVGSVMAHGPHTCPRAVIVASKARARESGVRWFIHVAETLDEVAEVAAATGGLSPVQYLDSLGVLDASTTVIHAVHLSAADVAVLAQRRVSVVHCPESNMKLGSGIAPIAELVQAGVNVGLGTDGAASNNDLSLFGEMGAAARLQKARLGDPAVLPARRVVEMATLGGARCLGLDHLVGSIEVGKRADLAVIDLRAPHLVPLYDIYSHLVYSCSASDVVHTVVDGRVLVRDRATCTVDVAEVMERARRFAGRVGPGGPGTTAAAGRPPRLFPGDS